MMNSPLMPSLIQEMVSLAKSHENDLHFMLKNSDGDLNKPPKPDQVEIYQRLFRIQALRSHLEHALWEAQYYVHTWPDDYAASPAEIAFGVQQPRAEANKQKVALHQALLDTAARLKHEMTIEEKEKRVQSSLEAAKRAVAAHQNGQDSERKW